MHRTSARTASRARFPLHKLCNNSTKLRTASPLAARAPLQQLERHAPGLKRHFTASSPISMSHPASSSPSGPGSNKSMKFKNLGVGLVASAIVAGGAVWYSTQTPSDAPAPAVVETPLQESRPQTALQPAGTAEPSVRKVVAVDDESIYTTTLPVSKKVEDEGGRKVLSMLSPEEATAKLRANEESYHVGRGRGVWRYDVVQIASNNPIEDDHSEKIIEVPSVVAPPNDGQSTSDWMFWGVFDGHSGWTTSAKLRQVLIGFVARELNETYKAAAAPNLPSPESIDAAIKKGFLRLDHEIVHAGVNKVLSKSSKLVAAETLAPALSGSCALLAFYESRSKLLRVACTGDSRAVLGRKMTNGNWSATALSADQTGQTPSEVARIRAEHPEEPYVIRNGRVLGGLEPTRAFGDAFYKWSHEVQMKLKMSYFGRSPSPLLKTPPYVTAEPVVTTTKIEPDSGDFVVMATDGLWEMLTNEEVVGLVGRWIDEQKARAAGRPNSPSSKGWFGWGVKEQKVLPIEKPPQGKEGENAGNKTPVRMLQWGVTAADDERFVFEDKNAATHLVRNALGGKDKDMLCALLTLVSPYSRRYRDDLTVEVIFFGKSDNSGEITVNEEATAPREVIEDLRAKL